MGNFRLYNVPPGEYLLNAAVEEAGNSGSPSSSYGTTYFPGVIEPERATPIAVTSNAERKASFAMVRASTVRVSGRIVDANGKGVSGGFVRLLKSTERAPIKMTQAKPDGTFSFDVRPASGEYTLAASTGSMRSMGASGGVPDSPLSGRLKLSVRDLGSAESSSGRQQGDHHLRPSILVDERPFDGRETIRVFVYPVEFDGALAGASAPLSTPMAGSTEERLRAQLHLHGREPRAGMADRRCASRRCNGHGERHCRRRTSRHRRRPSAPDAACHGSRGPGRRREGRSGERCRCPDLRQEESRWFHSGRVYVSVRQSRWRRQVFDSRSSTGSLPGRGAAVAGRGICHGSESAQTIARPRPSGCVLEGTKQTLQLRLQQTGAIRPELDFTAARKP